MTANDLPAINACLNATSAVLLSIGWAAIRRGNRQLHIRCMIASVCVSALFLCGYLYHQAHKGGPTRFPYDGWLWWTYMLILIPHSIAAAAVTPAIIWAVVLGAKGQFDRHERLTRWVAPIWLYVSVTGVIVYLMLYQLPNVVPPARPATTLLGGR